MIVGGLFISTNVSATSSRYDGKDLDQDTNRDNPAALMREKVALEIGEFFTFNLDKYIEQPDGSLVKTTKYEISGVSLRVVTGVNTGIIWEYVKIIPQAVFTMFFAKLIELIDIIISIIIWVVVIIAEAINLFISWTYTLLRIEWEYDRQFSEDQNIAFRTVDVYVPEGETQILGQMIHYLFTFTIVIIIMLLLLKILDQLIGIAGFDIPFI